MEFLGQAFQTLEHQHDRHTDTQRHARPNAVPRGTRSINDQQQRWTGHQNTHTSSRGAASKTENYVGDIGLYCY